MKLSSAIVAGVCALALGAVLISAAGVAVDQEEKITLDQVPAAVRAAMLREAGDGVIVQVTRDVEGGRTVYEAEILGADGWIEVEFDADGRVIEREMRGMDEDDDEDGDDDDGDDDDGDDDDGDPIRTSALPPNTLITLTELFGDRAFVVRAGQDNGQTVYEAKWEANGRAFEVEVTANGDVIEIEETIPASMVPESVRHAAATRLADATALTFTKHTVILYEAEGEVNGREREAMILATGRVVDRD